MDECIAALQGILDQPHGCPMCDSGVLRNAEKDHWPDCPYGIARAVLAKHPNTDLLKAELDGLRARHEALKAVLDVARRVLGCRVQNPEMSERLGAFSTALRRYEKEYGPRAVPIE